MLIVQEKLEVWWLYVADRKKREMICLPTKVAGLMREHTVSQSESPALLAVFVCVCVSVCVCVHVHVHVCVCVCVSSVCCCRLTYSLLLLRDLVSIAIVLCCALTRTLTSASAMTLRYIEPPHRGQEDTSLF